jgi:hypothetical protein
MRWHILRTLLGKEIARHLAERGALFLSALLVALALLIALFGKDEGQLGHFVAGLKVCYLDIWHYDAWINHLKQNRPVDPVVKIRDARQLQKDDEGHIIYPQSAAGIEVKQVLASDSGLPRFRVTFWYPGGDRTIVAPLVDWFWKETLQHFGSTTVSVVTTEEQTYLPAGAARIEVQPLGVDAEGRSLHRLTFLAVDAKGRVARPTLAGVEIEEERRPIAGSGDLRSLVTTGLVFFSLCFFGVYLLPSLTCEERERGVLLAQALSPAKAREILAAKFLFYPPVAISLAALVAGLDRPATLLRPFFWLVLLTSVMGYLGIGLSIACIARTQRSASLTALCYMLTVALLMFVTQLFGIPSVQYLFLEYYGPRMAHAALQNGPIPWWQWGSLVPTMLLACSWIGLSVYLFRRQGWQ